MKRKFLLPLFFSAIFFFQFSNLNACNYSAITLVGTPVNNNDGTYSITVRIVIGVMISWGGTTNFSLAPSGGTFSTVSSFSPMTLTSNYYFCSACNLTNFICDSPSTYVTATADGILNGPQTIINFNQASSLPATGCSPPIACWGNGFPFVADDYQIVCDSAANPDSLVWDIVIVTNGLPDQISFQGCEDDIGPDVMLSGGGCPEMLIINFPTSYCEIQNPGTNNSFLNLNLYSSQSFTLHIFSSDGKKISQKNYSLSSGPHQLNLPTQHLPQGIYFCRVAGEGMNRSFKFIK
jgi:hypothetical protein